MFHIPVRRIAGIVLFAWATITQAAFLDIVENYNSLTFGNVDVRYDQIEGKVAASGSLYLESFGVAKGVEASDFSVVAGRNVTLINGQVKNGGIYSGGTVSLTGVTVYGDIVQNGTASPVNFAEKLSEATTLSDMYAAQAATGTVTGSGNVTLSGTINGMNYFTIDAAKLASTGKLIVDIPDDAFAIINVSGSTVANAWGDYTSGVDADRVLFNFNEATSLTLNGSIDGSILAAEADVTLNYGNYYGAIVSKSLSGQGELHMANFGDKTESVPEGSTVAYLLLGGIALVVINRKKLVNNHC